MNPIRRLAAPLLPALLLAACSEPPIDTAQEPRSTVDTLGAPNAILQHEFTMLSSVRELADGRVLVADEKDNRLGIADFTTGEVTPIGRVGRGPREYRQVGRLWPLGGDSTLMVDPFSRRWYVIVDGKLLDAPAMLRPSESGPIAGASASAGIAYTVHSTLPSGKLTGLRDSMFVVRVAGAGATADTVGRVPSEHADYDPTKPPATLQLASGGVIPRTYRVIAKQLDQVVMFPDGWLAIARTMPYRVDWCPPARPCIAGTPIDTTTALLTEADKDVYLRDAVFSRGWPETVDPSVVTGWPDRMPPFSARTNRIDTSPLIPAADGRLLVERMPTAAFPSRMYDMVDRDGRRVRRLSVPLSHQVVAAGPQWLYIAVIDADGVQRLQRHPWR